VHLRHLRKKIFGAKNNIYTQLTLSREIKIENFFNQKKFMKKPDKILYKSSVNVKGGREGSAKSADGKLDIKLSTPKELGGNGGDGTNPEQIFAAGYSACFMGALKSVAEKEKIKLPEDFAINGEVGIGPNANLAPFLFYLK
jgi:Ohr subfamily peroxiredoxin